MIIFSLKINWLENNSYSGTPHYGHPVNTITSLLRPLYFWPGKTAIHSFKKTPLLQSPVNTANDHFFKFPAHTILHNFYNLTPLLRPLEKTKTPVTFQFQ